MAKLPKKYTSKEIFAPVLNILDINSSEYINSTSLEYSKGTLVRKIPAIDGLIDAQRKAIYSLSSVSGFIKTVSCAGKMISDDIYLHGDSSAVSVLQNLASPVKNNYPLIGKKGGFGVPANPTPASGRYTYVEKNKITEVLVLKDFDIIPMVENYDGSKLEPLHFLPLIPLSLLIGEYSGGSMAVGYKSVILPYKLNDIVDNTIRCIKGEELKVMLPCFTSVGASERVTKYDNGYIAYGKIEIIDSSTVRVYGLPPSYKLDSFREKLILMIDDNTVRSFIDATTKDVDITIKIPRGAALNWTEEDAIEYFGLSRKIPQNLRTLDVNNLVKNYEDPNDIIIDYVAHRIPFFYKRYNKYKDDAIDKLSYYFLIKECFDRKIVEQLNVLKSKSLIRDMVNNINNDGILAESKYVDNIVEMPLYRWTDEYYTKLLKDIDDLLKEIDEYENILLNESRIKEIYIKELEEIKKLKFPTYED